MKFSEMLLKRLSEKLGDAQPKKEGEVVEKGYVPYNAYTFSDLDVIRQATEFKNKLFEIYYEFIMIGENIIYDFPNEAPEKLLALTEEFVTRLRTLQKNLASGQVAVFKGTDGVLYWVGIPTNKFMDRENDIFSDASHRKLVKSIEDGEVQYPELLIWHNKPAVGNVTWIDYDERGFLLAGGTIKKEYEEMVINLLANVKEPVGMSQGIYTKDIQRDSDGTIISYSPFEFTFLPLKNACNLLTSFTTEV